MGMIDAFAQFHNDTAVTAAAPYAGDSLALREVGKFSEEMAGEPMEILVQVTEAFAGGTNCIFSFVSANNAALTSSVTQATTNAVLPAVLVVGKKYRFPISFTVADPDATHIGVLAVSSGTHTAGKFSAWVQRANDDQFTIND